VTSPWPAPLAAAADHPHLQAYRALTSDPVSAEAATSWKFRLLLRWEGLTRLLDALEAARLPHVVVKGIAAALELYPTPFARPFSDVDLFVAPEAYGAAVDLLVAQGYNPTPSGIRDPIHRTFRKEDQLPVELHFKTSRDFQDDPRFLRALVASGDRIPMGEGFLRRPDPVHHTVYILLHARNHSFLNAPMWALDLLLMERRHRGTLDAARALCEHHGWGPVFNTAMLVAGRLFSDPLGALKTHPRDLTLIPHATAALVSAAMQGRLPHFPSTVAIRLFLQNSWKERVLWLLTRA